MVGAVVGFGQHGVEDVSDPAVAGAAVVGSVGVQLSEELGDVGVGPVREVCRLTVGAWGGAAEVAADQVG